MEVPTLAIVCHEGHPPADDTFAYPGCPQPAPARSPRPGPGPAGETRSPAPTGGLLAIGIAAVIAGSRSFAAIGQRAADADEEVLAGPGAARGPAEESTFRRAFALVSPDLLDRVPDAWLHTRRCRPAAGW